MGQNLESHAPFCSRETVNQGLLQVVVEGCLVTGVVREDVADGLQGGGLERRDEVVRLQTAICDVAAAKLCLCLCKPEGWFFLPKLGKFDRHRARNSRRNEGVDDWGLLDDIILVGHSDTGVGEEKCSRRCYQFDY